MADNKCNESPPVIDLEITLFPQTTDIWPFDKRGRKINNQNEPSNVAQLQY